MKKSFPNGWQIVEIPNPVNTKAVFQWFLSMMFFLLLFPVMATAEAYQNTRLNDSKPLISLSMFAQQKQADKGANINGPSLIRLPDWLPRKKRADPGANYYLYFANHSGAQINMAWAPDIVGPYTLFNVHPGQGLGEGGVLAMGSDRRINLMHSLSIIGHIASPEVVVDHVQNQFVMYFHGPAEFRGKRLRGQKSFVSTSGDGLYFGGGLYGEAGKKHGIRSIMLGNSYFRVFTVDGTLYALSNGGGLHRAHSTTNPWTPPEAFDYGQILWERREEPLNLPEEYSRGRWMRYRHFSIMRRDNHLLELFYSLKGDAPECIMRSMLDVSGSWDNWSVKGIPEKVTCPEETWEGAEKPVLPSTKGPAKGLVNQLRDPYVYTEDGVVYLFYAGGGESAIGLARLEMLP